MAEWLNAAVLKTVKDASPSGVRIPDSPPYKIYVVNALACIVIYSVEDYFGDRIPTEYNLNQNFPNPYNPITTIKYQIPEFSFVTLKVYDVLGNEVAILVNEEKPIGNYGIEFDATTLPSGIYFYRLRAGDFIETKKMILLK